MIVEKIWIWVHLICNKIDFWWQTWPIEAEERLGWKRCCTNFQTTCEALAEYMNIAEHKYFRNARTFTAALKGLLEFKSDSIWAESSIQAEDTDKQYTVNLLCTSMNTQHGKPHGIIAKTLMVPCCHIPWNLVFYASSVNQYNTERERENQVWKKK